MAEKVSNKEMLVHVHAKETKRILKTIWHGEHRMLGHVLTHENLLCDIIEGKVMGEATNGRKRM